MFQLLKRSKTQSTGHYAAVKRSQLSTYPTASETPISRASHRVKKDRRASRTLHLYNILKVTKCQVENSCGGQGLGMDDGWDRIRQHRELDRTVS